MKTPAIGMAPVAALIFRKFQWQMFLEKMTLTSAESPWQQWFELPAVASPRFCSDLWCRFHLFFFCQCGCCVWKPRQVPPKQVPAKRNSSSFVYRTSRAIGMVRKLSLSYDQNQEYHRALPGTPCKMELQGKGQYHWLLVDMQRCC